MYPFYSRNSLGVDVVKNQLLAVKHNGDRCMVAINGDVLLKSIAVDIAKRLLLAACGKEKLIAWDCLGDQKVADGGSAVKAGENRKAFSDRGNSRSE
jgi:predicted RNA-binding protein